MICTTDLEVARLCRYVCTVFNEMKHPPRNYVQLMLGTAAVESSFQHRIGYSGSAFGLWQMEIDTAQWLLNDKLKPAHELEDTMRDSRWEKFIYIWLGLEGHVPHIEFETKDLKRLLVNNDPFACALSRIRYLVVPDPIPESIREIAKYWKKHYNTVGGLGTTDAFIRAWNELECDELMEIIGYL